MLSFGLVTLVTLPPSGATSVRFFRSFCVMTRRRLTSPHSCKTHRWLQCCPPLCISLHSETFIQHHSRRTSRPDPRTGLSDDLPWRPLVTDEPQKRRDMYIDLSIGLGFPGLIMALRMYAHTGRRLFADIVCSPQTTSSRATATIYSKIMVAGQLLILVGHLLCS